MKILIIIIIFTGSLAKVFSQNAEPLFLYFDEKYYYHNKVEHDLNFGIQFVFPPPHESAFGFFGISRGIAYGIIQEYFYVGMAGDIAIGWDWFALFSRDAERERERERRENYQLGILFGTRVYSLFQLRNFRLWSFIGCDIFLIYPMPYMGMELSYKNVGFEYTYYFPIYSDNITRHRISIKFHLHDWRY